jgi:cbb3-type cytochrome oxidase subunit 1
MARYSTAFIWASLAYFTIGICLGVAMAIDLSLLGTLRLVHVHLNLLGWVSMFIYGVAYHVIPRFTGNPLHSPRLADLHVVLANVGLIGMAVGFAIWGPGPLVAIAGTAEAIGGFIFVYNIARTMAPRAVRATPLPMVPSRSLAR